MTTCKITSHTAILFLFCFSLACSDHQPSFEKGHQAYLKQDYETAFQHFLPLAKKGNPKAQIYTAMFYWRGYGVPQDKTKAFEWTKKAAEQGNAEAQYYLAQHYHDGDGTIQSDEKALQWLGKSASQNHDGASRLLKHVNQYGWPGTTPKD